MRVTRHAYSQALVQAAEDFLINQFEAPTQFTEASHLPDLIDAAMHIVTGADWVQPGTSRGTGTDVPVDEYGVDDDEEEDEDDE